MLEKKSHGGAREASPHFEDLKTSQKIAKETGVSHATIERDAQYAQAVDALATEMPKEILTQVMKQNPKKDIILGALQPHISILSKA